MVGGKISHLYRHNTTAATNLLAH